MQKLFNVENKVAIITGGLGQLGRQYTKALLENAAKVAIFDIATKRQRILPKTARLKIYKTDITKKESLEKSLKNVVRDFGNPSILINNAALDVPPGASKDETNAFETYPEKLWDKTCDVNLKGVFLTCQVVGSFMAKNGGGSIINISSVYGNVSPDQGIYEYRKEKGKSFFKPASYSVTKAGVINFSRYLATYWAGKGVRVNTLSLGGVFNNQDKSFIKEYSKRVPMKRMAKEDEYNGAILFLASDASSYMTGSNLIIDGGMTAW